MAEFDPGRLRAACRSLPDWKRVAFMAMCCERMLTSCAGFSAETGSGDAAALRRALDAVWRWVESDGIAEDRDDLVAACDRLAPDTAEFVSPCASAALNATNAIAVTLEILGEATEDRLVEVATLARDTVDVFVRQRHGYDPGAADLGSWISNDPLMREELARQNETLAFLKHVAGPRSGAAGRLRSAWTAIETGSLPRAASPKQRPPLTGSSRNAPR